jgi:hypothetical protein
LTAAILQVNHSCNGISVSCIIWILNFLYQLRRYKYIFLVEELKYDWLLIIMGPF